MLQDAILYLKVIDWALLICPQYALFWHLAMLVILEFALILQQRLLKVSLDKNISKMPNM